MPVGSGPSSEGPSEVFWRGWPPQLPYGGSTRFYGDSTRRQGHLGWFAGAAAAVRELPGSSGRLSPCLPDDGAPRCGCRRLVLACSSIPADRDHRFRRSEARTGHAARVAAPLFACGMWTRAALVVLAWAGDGSPIRGCITTTGDQVPPRTLFRKVYLRTGAVNISPGRSVCAVRVLGKTG